MLNIISLILAGSVFVYIAKDNLTPVTLSLAQYTIADIPLFFVILGSLLVGLILSYLVQLVGSIATSFVLRGNKQVIKSSKDEILELTKRVHQLELENEKLKTADPVQGDPNAL